MIKLDDRLTIRNKVLESLKSSLPWIGNQVRSLHISSRGKNHTDRPVDEVQADKEPIVTEAIPENTFRLPRLQEVLELETTRDAYSILLGLCDDGVPLTMNLTNPAPGSVLITSDPDAGKTRLVHSILDSAAIINTPEQVLFYIITPDIHEYTDLAELPNCQKLAPHDSQSAMQIIQELYDESEKRRTKSSELMLVLVIEQVDSFIGTVDPMLFSLLMRLIKHGPRLGIWIFGTLSSAAVDQLDPLVLEAFRTHLLGYISEPELANYLARTDDFNSRELSIGNQFCAFVGGSWYSFWICDNSGGGL